MASWIKDSNLGCRNWWDSPHIHHLAKAEHCILKRVAYKSSLSTKIKHQLFDPFVVQMVEQTKQYQQSTARLKRVYSYLVALLHQHLTKDTSLQSFLTNNRMTNVFDYKGDQPEQLILDIFAPTSISDTPRFIQYLLSMIILSKWHDLIQSNGIERANAILVRYLKSLKPEDVVQYSGHRYPLSLKRELGEWMDQLEAYGNNDDESEFIMALSYDLAHLFDLFRNFPLASSAYDRLLRVLSGSEKPEVLVERVSASESSSSSSIRGLDLDIISLGGSVVPPHPVPSHRLLVVVS
jgi:hypothetical protein